MIFLLRDDLQHRHNQTTGNRRSSSPASKKVVENQDSDENRYAELLMSTVGEKMLDCLFTGHKEKRSHCIGIETQNFRAATSDKLQLFGNK